MTLIDALDMLAVMGDKSEFRKWLCWIEDHWLNFDMDRNVSVFESSIRVLGGLLSSHLFAESLQIESCSGGSGTLYNGTLLVLARDLGDRLLPAFSQSPSGIPYGTVNLRSGVPPGETTVTSVAGATTFSLEFGVLSALTGDERYARAAKKAVKRLWAHRTPLNLVGNHLDIVTGNWIHLECSIGGSIDSFYEYLWKAAILFSDADYMAIFDTAYEAIVKHSRAGPWYVEVHPFSGGMLRPFFGTLQGYFPGLQSLMGEEAMVNASETLRSFASIWRAAGFTPEGWNLISQDPVPGRLGYPLRPELAESYYYLYKATKDPLYLEFAADILYSLDTVCRTRCGFANVADVRTRALEDKMESFVLAETLKYLFLTFDIASEVPRAIIHAPNASAYVFSTEAHPFPMDVIAPLRDAACAGATSLNIPLRDASAPGVRPVHEIYSVGGLWWLPPKGEPTIHWHQEKQQQPQLEFTPLITQGTENLAEILKQLMGNAAGNLLSILSSRAITAQGGGRGGGAVQVVQVPVEEKIVKANNGQGICGINDGDDRGGESDDKDDGGGGGGDDDDVDDNNVDRK